LQTIHLSFDPSSEPEDSIVIEESDTGLIVILDAHWDVPNRAADESEEPE